MRNLTLYIKILSTFLPKSQFFHTNAPYKLQPRYGFQKESERHFLLEYKRSLHLEVSLTYIYFSSFYYRYRLIGLDLPKPQLDVVTRWGSTYIMLQRLLQFKEFCQNNISAADQLNTNEWVAITNVVSVLELANNLTQKLQTAQLILGDFYKCWMELVFNLRSLNSDIANKLLSKIEARQESLLENETIYSALYLDPRFRRSLNNVKKEAAKRHLKKLFCQMRSLEMVNNLLDILFVD